MALIKCPECGKEVSNRAEACVYCGYPLHQREKTQNEGASLPQENMSVGSNSEEPITQSASNKLTQLLDRQRAPKGKRGNLKKWGALAVAVVVVIVVIAVVAQPSPEEVLMEDVTESIWDRSREDVLSGIEKRLQAMDSNYALEISTSDEPENEDSFVVDITYNETPTNVLLSVGQEDKMFSLAADALVNEETYNAFLCVMKAVLLENDWKDRYSNIEDVDQYISEIFDAIENQSLSEQYNIGTDPFASSTGHESISDYSVIWVVRNNNRSTILLAEQ